ncbi:Fe-S oxidoreductase [Leucobacter sp. UT-8R-CII-1-4]|uniref:Fe-S oxidoreductase n=1 Tax=Leucobacter sp. UT-8R-CII-1-4 TaxID=3040075 RepID=UPI0024A9D5F3|nr:Fe-S oxidoreductase [Leucobacter sp. UT-8R-CII-1-4]MDI6024423.1 Fe-S oxidoreductase [Leucobacter sp. UT-8R-CII-1-4]
MQLGARWRVGDPPHRSVPPSLHQAIAEAELAHPSAASWTLTWLEGRPRCELDDLALVTLTATGDVSSSQLQTLSGEDDDDDWLL